MEEDYIYALRVKEKDYGLIDITKILSKRINFILGLINGGERGIRTLETVSRLHAFQACAFNHSATSPLR